MNKLTEPSVSIHARSTGENYQRPPSGPSGLLFCGLSILLHLLLLITMMFVQNLSFVNPMPPAVQVDLVSFAPGLPDEIPLAEEYDTPSSPEETDVLKEPLEHSDVEPEPVPEVEPAVEPEVETPAEVKMEPVQPEKKEPEPIVKDEMPPAPIEQEKAEPKKPVVEKPDPPVKKASLKKKTYDAEKVKAVKQKTPPKDPPPPKKQAQKVEEQQPPKDNSNTLANALKRLRNKVESQQTDKNRAASRGTASGSTGGRAPSQAIDLYNLELMYRIREHWVFNKKFAREDRDLEKRLVVLVIKILKSGEIRDVWFETRSGNTYLDESALKAVKKSNPLPPLPAGYSSYDVGLSFTPSGLQ